MLYSQDLEVRIEATVLDIELDTVDYVTVVITTIVYNNTLLYKSNDIRPKYLSFNKFYSIIELTDPNFNLKRKSKILT